MMNKKNTCVAWCDKTKKLLVPDTDIIFDLGMQTIWMKPVNTKSELMEVISHIEKTINHKLTSQEIDKVKKHFDYKEKL